jgi:hypothetical protein
MAIQPLGEKLFTFIAKQEKSADIYYTLKKIAALRSQ